MVLNSSIQNWFLFKVTCQKSLELAKKMQYGSCTEAIEELCNSYNGYLKLYFL